MIRSRLGGSSTCVALFDLDGTLTWRDTLLPFLMRYALHHPQRLLRLSSLLPATLSYLADRDRGLLKSRFIRAAMGGDVRVRVDSWADDYVSGLMARETFRAEALSVVEEHRAAGDRLVLLSASPDLYVPRIGALLGFERTLCTEVSWRQDRLEGALRTPNRRGEEKSRCLAWLRTQYPGLPVVAYGNSASDLPHMRKADQALLVNANGPARREAAAAGIPVADWR
jgi:phosphatidylglycerophosphatase C